KETKSPVVWREENNFRGKTIIYRKNSISKWFSVGLADYSRFPSVFSLQPLSADRSSDKALSLVLMESYDTPWILIAENVKEDLLLSFQHMKRQMEEADMAQVKPSVVARFGKFLFYGSVFF
ncbi:hypothetical protein H5410_021011, partial [Solanum commersonii]